jgi:hypothetical protein
MGLHRDLAEIKPVWSEVHPLPPYGLDAGRRLFLDEVPLIAGCPGRPARHSRSVFRRGLPAASAKPMMEQSGQAVTKKSQLRAG